MEPSQVIEDAEECSSSESGWTMYLSSPIHDDGVGEEVDADDGHDHDDDGGGHGDDDGGGGNAYSNENDGGDGNDEDGDSMASDASTGPARHEHACQNCHMTDLMGESIHHGDEDEVEDNFGQYSSELYKKHYKKLENKREEYAAHRKGTSTLPPHSSSKVRKTELASM